MDTISLEFNEPSTFKQALKLSKAVAGDRLDHELRVISDQSTRLLSELDPRAILDESLDKIENALSNVHISKCQLFHQNAPLQLPSQTLAK